MSREDRRTAAREGILAAAHRLLAEGGCASASMAGVAARAGVAAGTLYRHFPSRAALLAEVVGDALRGEHALLARAAQAPDAREALAAWVRTAVERALGAPELMAALLLEPADAAVEAVRGRERRAREATLAALLERGATQGAWPAGDAALGAAVVDGALRAALVGPEAAERLGGRPDPAGQVAALTRLVLAAVGG